MQVGHSHSQETSARQGSYYSTGPAGGRPASGLSRRRTQFRGPPTSFYRNGGWGEHSTKRSAAQNNGAPGDETKESEGLGGMGPAQSPWIYANDVPHFDKEGHFGTHDSIHQRMQKRKRKLTEDEESVEREFGRSMGMLGRFIIIGAVLMAAVLLPASISTRMQNRKSREK
jgi:hypothetical protein